MKMIVAKKGRSLDNLDPLEINVYLVTVPGKAQLADILKLEEIQNSQ